MPMITGELSPSPPISPSPAPTMKTRLSTSKVNRMLDIHRTTPPNILPTLEQVANIGYSMAATAPRSKQAEQPERIVSETSTPARPTHNRLPLFNQVMEVASLQPQKVANRPEQKDPLDKYSSGITIPIHDAHPRSAYTRIKQEVLDEWRNMEGEMLLAIPFGSDAETPESHNETGDRIFTAISEIIHAKDYGVASPMKREDLQTLLDEQRHQQAGQKQKRPGERLPTTFLIHSLSQIHYQILMQQTVWASQTITFRITPPEMNCPSFLFAIKGLRTNSSELVEKCIRDTWNDETTTQYIQNGVAAMEQNERDNILHSIQRFKDSMWVETLETKGQGGIQKPTFNVHADGNFINDSNAWSNIRTHLAGRSYHSSKFGHGQALIAPNHCGLCHGVDHPRGMCPFPEINGWKGPNEFTQRMGKFPRNSGRFPPGARY